MRSAIAAAASVVIATVRRETIVNAARQGHKLCQSVDKEADKQTDSKTVRQKVGDR